jgi:hypothetical protein
MTRVTGLHKAGDHDLRNSSGSLAMFAAIRSTSFLLINFGLILLQFSTDPLFRE